MRGETRFSRSNPARVLIADDQALYREGLREIMGHWPEFQVIGEAADGWSALSCCRKHRPDMVIMDNMMPLLDGIEATRRITRELEQTVVVMLTVSAAEEDLVRAFDAGACGYLLKETPSRQIRALLKDALHGDTVVPASVVRQLVSAVVSTPVGRFRASEEHSTVALDAEERDVMKLVAQGLSNEAIGAALYISPGSVKKRLKAIMDKLKLDNRVQVAVYAVRHGISGEL